MNVPVFQEPHFLDSQHDWIFQVFFEYKGKQAYIPTWPFMARCKTDVGAAKRRELYKALLSVNNELFVDGNQVKIRVNPWFSFSSSSFFFPRYSLHKVCDFSEIERIYRYTGA